MGKLVPNDAVPNFDTASGLEPQRVEGKIVEITPWDNDIQGSISVEGGQKGFRRRHLEPVCGGSEPEPSSKPD
jgi:hypothetical protein